MRLMKLTEHDSGEAIYINPRRVSLVGGRADGSRVVFRNGFALFVTEPPAEVANLFADAMRERKGRAP